MSLRLRLVLAAAALLVNAGAAVAQYYYWPESSYGPQSGAADDPYAEPKPRRPRARANWPFDEERRDPPRARNRAPREKDEFERRRLAALPPDADPDYSTPIDYDDDVDMRQTRRRFVADPTAGDPGTLTIDTRARRLYLSLEDGRAVEYAIGVGRTGFSWKGEAKIGRKAFWPGWTPPPEMLERRPDLPEHMDGGLRNPLGARALYLFQGQKDTLFRIHGTNEPESIGRAVSSGCIRMLNADVIDLYGRVAKGARVVVR
ncbi:L,D-transpeptidase [Methylosinus sporium]|uniref:L,D-transpeptidase n=1 Tax=Methylosinus sporium TaxID=428 RepID=A0A2U1SRN2_METSR|nr:L,D-transpeptidase [Methylosinus sporium]PWB94260.1 L,D-transpeptidase [Methylosinus sporium]